MTNEYVPRAREHAAAWKATAELPDEARADAPYIRDGDTEQGRYSYCLPAHLAAHNLLHFPLRCR